MIIKEEQPKQRKVTNPEDKLKVAMFMWYDSVFIGAEGGLVATFQETYNPKLGAIKKSRGLVRGVPDFLFFPGEGLVIGIEVKVKDTYHNSEHIREQCAWLIKWPHIGLFCDDLEDFKRIIRSKGKEGGIYPRDVLRKVNQTDKNSFKWGS